MVVLIIITGFLALIALDFFIHRDRYLAEMRGEVRLAAAPGLPPAGYFLDGGHGWATLEPAGTVKVGAGPVILALLGAPDRVTTPAVGESLSRGQGAATVYRGSRSLPLRAAVEGEVVEVNHQLLAHPARLAEDPYRAGWLYRVDPRDLGRALSGLRVHAEARQWLREELSRLREAVAPGAAALGATALDGGLPLDGLSDHLDDEAWSEVVETLLGQHS